MSAHSLDSPSASFDDTARPSFHAWLLPTAATCAIVLIGVALTALLAWWAEQTAVDLTERTLEERSIRAERTIASRLLACEAVLHAAAGFIDNAWPITSEQWYRFVHPLQQSSIAPGVQGFGFAPVLDRLTPEQFELASRHRWMFPSGAEYQPLRTVILFLEPQDERNKHAMGFDMASEPRRRAAMEAARDSGTAMLSSKLVLVQEIDAARAQPGFNLYVPVYVKDVEAATVEERRRALLGYVYSTFRAGDFLSSVFHYSPEDVRLDVYDGARTTSAARLYTRGSANGDLRRLSFAHRFFIAGHEWTVQVTATPVLLANNRRVPGWLIWIAGIATTALLSSLVFAMARSRQVLRERLSADARLIEQQRDAATMLENSLVAFIAIDRHDRILEWNQQATHTFGWAKHEVLGCKLAEIIVPESMRDAHLDAIKNFHSRKHTLLDRRVDVPAIRRDGKELIVALSVTSVERRGETVFFASVRDITARRKQQEQLRQLNATLEQRVSERTEELEQAHRQLQNAYRDLEAFSRSVSHDLRAPLRAIQGYAGFLVQGVGSSLAPEIARDIEAIARTARHMSVILDNLLKLASVSQSELKAEEFSLGELVRQVVEEIGPRPEIQVRIESEQLGCVCADPGLLALALRNLIGNALKFSAKQPQPQIHIGASEREGERAYFVKDNGVGFDPKYAERLFGAFQRLHSGREFEGTGLGLTIVKSVIEKNRGRVWAESSPGAGATFYFTLPACQAA
jgi:PAS domain S-box-containing protein